jgi:hypothetical protein
MTVLENLLRNFCRLKSYAGKSIVMLPEIG